MVKFQQIGTNGGHLVICETEVADGHLQLVDSFQHIYGEDAEVAGSQHVLRTVYLNGHMVLDPDYAQQLWAEACRS